MRLVAVDLSRITGDDLRFRPQPVSEWPTVEIEVNDVREQTCIASWRRDVESANETSNRLSECAWDALHLGFSYLLCDIVSIPQNAHDLPERIIEFSRLYESLPAVIAYDVDPHIRRTWLSHEARMILRSPTKLPYVYNKWTLQIPLILSHVIRQICTRRLGMHDLNTEKLPLCDDDESYELSLGDLELFKGRSRDNDILTISLDRRDQKFSSDVLLVYELNLRNPRRTLISKLSSLQSNSVGIPALVSIWAMIEGLTISVRGCDWDVAHIVEWIKATLREACSSMNEVVSVKVAEDDSEISLRGAIKGTIRPQIVGPPEMLGLDQPKNLFVYNRDEPAKANDRLVVSRLLETCIDFVRRSIEDQRLKEPVDLSADTPQYELRFDETPGHDDVIPTT